MIIFNGLLYTTFYVAGVEEEIHDRSKRYYGSVLSYSMTIAFVGGAFLVFLYLWIRGSLGIDEEAKEQMMMNYDEGGNG